MTSNTTEYKGCEYIGRGGKSYILDTSNEEELLVEYEIFNLNWLDEFIISDITKDFANYIPCKIFIRINLIDSKEYDYDVNVLYDVVKNFQKYYSIKIQFRKNIIVK